MTDKESVDVNATIGAYADYFDTGIWSLTKTGCLVAPDDVTVRQLKDFLTASGGAVYLRQDGKFGWISGENKR